MRKLALLVTLLAAGCTAQQQERIADRFVRQGADAPPAAPDRTPELIAAIREIRPAPPAPDRTDEVLEAIRELKRGASLSGADGSAPAGQAEAHAGASQPRVFKPLVVYCSGAGTCPPCDQFKKENPDGLIEAYEGVIPYTINDRVATHPAWVRAGGYPQFELADPWSSYAGYYGKDRLVQWYMSKVTGRRATGADNGSGSYGVTPLYAVNGAPAYSAAPAYAASQGYPVRPQSTWWTDQATGQYVSWQHLTQGEHVGQFDPAWLQSLSFEQLQSLHADAHENKVNWNYARRPGMGAGYGVPLRRTSYAVAVAGPAYVAYQYGASVVTSRYAASSRAAQSRSDRRIARWQRKIAREQVRQSAPVAVQYQYRYRAPLRAAVTLGLCPAGGC